MIGIQVRLKAKPGREDELEQVAYDMAAAVREHEPGALFFRLFRTQTKGEYVIIERWKDQAALDAHRQAGHTAPFRARFADVLESPAQVVALEEVPPA